MASYCPKCNHKLKITDWRPTCPNCGVNLVYYGIEDRLLDDADKAEAEHAHFQKKIDRLKAAYVGSPLAIVRIVVSLLPILALLLPLAKLNFNAPFIGEHAVSINAIKLYEGVSALNFDALLSLFKSGTATGAVFIFYALSIVFVLVAAVFALLHLILLFLSCSPKGYSRNLTLCILGMVFAVASLITYSVFSSKALAVFPGVITESGLGIGAFVFVVMFLVPLAINIIIKTKGGIEVKYKECFVGGIPSAEYDRMIKEGVSVSDIRKIMAVKTAEKEAAAAEEAAKKLAEEETVAGTAEEETKEPETVNK